MSKTIRFAVLLLIPLAIAGCRLYEHARHAAVHALVMRGVQAMKPLAQSTYRPAPLHETITVTAKAPEVAEVEPDPAPLPVVRSLASIGAAPGVNLCTRPIPTLRLAQFPELPKEIVRCRVTIDTGRRVIVIDTSSL